MQQKQKWMRERELEKTKAGKEVMMFVELF
jgi:hypothetical protein